MHLINMFCKLLQLSRPDGTRPSVQNRLKNGTAIKKDVKNKKVFYRDEQQIFVGRLKYSFTKDMLRNHFRRYGSVVDVNLKDGSDKSKPNFAFVTFEDAASVKSVLNNLVSLLLNCL